MKSKDFGLLAVVAIFAVVFSVLLSKVLLASPKNLQEKVEVVQPISTTFNLPDERYFNKDANNPTRLIKIGENQNQDPFNKH